MCINCSANFFSSEFGSTYCLPCPSGSYSLTGASICIVNYTGGDSLGKGTSTSAALAASSGNIGLTEGIIIGAIFLVVLVTTIVIIAIIIGKKRRSDIRNLYATEMPTHEIIYNSIQTEYPSVSALVSSSMTENSLNNSLGQSLNISNSSNWNIPYESIEIIKELGRGAYGIVFKAIWRKQEVALKIISSDSSQQLEDFKNEFLLMKSLRPHKHVVQLLGMVQNPLCIILNYYEKGSLLGLLKSQERITLDRKLTIMKGIVSGMIHLHEEGIIHRDLAARNVLLTKNYDSVVADFGYSRFISGKESGTTASVVGPLKWMAIESFTTHQYSKKSDVWSFGVTAWEIITRENPWENLDAVQAAFAVQGGKRLPIPEDEMICPASLAHLISSCWMTDPESRPMFEEIWNELQKISSEKKLDNENGNEDQ